MDPKPGIVPSDPGSEKGGGMGLSLTAWKMGGMMSGWKRGGRALHTHISPAPGARKEAVSFSSEARLYCEYQVAATAAVEFI